MLVFLLIWLITFGVAGENNPDVANEIQQHRIQRDDFFRTSSNSPLPEEHKQDFRGLKYFAIDLAYRFKLPLHKYSKTDTTVMITSMGTKREAIKYGYFKFKMSGKSCKLTVYKMVDLESDFPKHLFVPFLDSTSGNDSYGGGRYIDLEENESSVYILDFNMAYNPSCAYGKHGYVCPIPPAGNRLDLPVRAGEKVFQKSHLSPTSGKWD